MPGTSGIEAGMTTEPAQNPGGGKGHLLVTGGAGYIGSHVALACLEAGYRVVVLDSLSAGHPSMVPTACHFIEGDVGDRDTVRTVLAEHPINAVVHLAASISVPESMRDPLRYYRNNTAASASLIQTCVDAGIGQFVFSSTAAVYGAPDIIPVSESAPTLPVNPYGRSKLATEWALRDTAAAHDFRYVALRYFNVAGADPHGRAGPHTGGATHLITVACEAAVGLRDHITVFGTDYSTADGTCVRDYIHVSDLAGAHLAALDDLEAGGTSRVLNCGYGTGHSVREVLEAVQAESGIRLDIREGERRAGDPPALVADTRQIHEALRWTPRHDDLRSIVRSTLAWSEASLRAGKPE